MENNLKVFSREDEKLIFHWFISEIIFILKRRESRGNNDFRFLTKIKTQKIIFQICEDHNLNLTRMWYMFGGMVFTPFNITTIAEKYYYNKASITKKDFSNIEKLLGKNRIKRIKESLYTNFENIFYKKTEDFLADFYENKAPPIYRELYSHFRSIMTLYKGVSSSHTQLDFHLRSILPNFNPWTDTLKIQHVISEFQVEVAGIFKEHELRIVLAYTRLIENVAIQICWMKFKEIKISEKQGKVIKTILDEFINIGWKYLATTIGIKTVKGASAERWRKKFFEQRESLKKTVETSLELIQNEILSVKLKPNFDVMKEFFNSEYLDIFNEAMGAYKEFENQSSRNETIKKC